MAQQISDLVINLDVDSATFSEQVARIKGQLTEWGHESEKCPYTYATGRRIAGLGAC